MLNSTQTIIDAFELYTGNSLSISTSQELELAQKIYDQVLEEFEPEFLKKTLAGTLPTSVDYVAQPADFNRLTEKRLMYVAPDLSRQKGDEYYVVPFEDRRMYVNQKGYLYYDARQGRFIFTKQPDDAKEYEMDYIYVPPALDLTSSNPLFPIRYYPVIYHGMLINNDIIEMSEKARAYTQENTDQYTAWLNRLKDWNSRQTNLLTVGI